MLTLTDNQVTAIKVAATGAMIVGGVVWSKTQPPDPIRMKNADYDNQSVVVDEKEGTRSSQFVSLPKISRGKFSDMKTLYDIFQCGLYYGESEPCLGFKSDNVNYTWLTYNEVETNSVKTGSGIIHRLNQAPGQETKIGIFMKNCVEWVYVEQACTRYSMLLVPLYDTLGEDACTYVINHVKCQVIFVDALKKIDFLIRTKSRMPDLKYIVTVKDIDRDVIQSAEKEGLNVVHFREILEDGSKYPAPLVLPNPEDTSTILFTSGTTGIPKGCAITHKGLLSSVASALNLTEIINIGKKQETHLSFLPLTHVYERLVHILMFLFSGKIAFFSGEIRFLGEEMKIIKPTILFAVPRILNRIYDKVMFTLAQSPIKKLLFDIGFSRKLKEVEKGIIRKNSFWDYMMFNRVQDILGGKIDIIMVGSAPVSPEVMNFFRSVMGCLVFEGYGQTETTGPVTLTLPGDNDTGQVGCPVPEVLLKLSDVPELDIVVARDQRGEICVKGKMCIKEYFGDPEMSKQLIDSDGWLHTGDIGFWTEKGQLKIVDRCKHIFKLAQGEYLAPERLENIYSLSSLVSQIFVTGDSLRDFCVAVVIPDIDGWKAIDAKYDTIESICSEKDAVGIIEKDLQTVGRENKLLGFEIVKKVCLSSSVMSPENGLLTPTLKLKRKEVSKFFAKEIQSMYT